MSNKSLEHIELITVSVNRISAKVYFSAESTTKFNGHLEY